MNGGCGEGRLTGYLKELEHQIIGVDALNLLWSLLRASWTHQWIFGSVDGSTIGPGIMNATGHNTRAQLAKITMTHARVAIMFTVSYSSNHFFVSNSR